MLYNAKQVLGFMVSITKSDDYHKRIRGDGSVVLYGFSWLIKHYGTSFCDIIESQRGAREALHSKGPRAKWSMAKSQLWIFIGLKKL